MIFAVKLYVSQTLAVINDEKLRDQALKRATFLMSMLITGYLFLQVVRSYFSYKVYINPDSVFLFTIFLVVELCLFVLDFTVILLFARFFKNIKKNQNMTTS